MQPNTINLVCSTIALLAGAAIFARHWMVSRARARATKAPTLEVPADQVFRSYSVYIDAQKVALCKTAGLVLDAQDSQLTFHQFVPMSAPSYRKLKRCLCLQESVNVVVGQIDGDMLALGEMNVAALMLDTDMTTGVTTLETILVGPSLVKQVESKPLIDTRTSAAN